MEAYYDIRLRLGETHQFELGGLGSAGYAWEYATEGDTGVVSVNMERSHRPSRARTESPDPDSSSLEQQVVIKAMAPGRITIRLALRRPWERDEPPLREILMKVTVY